MNEARQITLGDIVAARRRISKALRPTPLVHAYNLSQRTGVDLYLKLESSHITGSFKERGALNCLMTLTDAQREAGVVAASAGNHAQGLSLHATRLGVKATIVMPENTPIVKVTRTSGYGGNVMLHGATFDDANARARALCLESGATYVSAFNHPAVIAGQGTCALEVLERDDDFDAIIVPVGGGGLLAGMSTAFKEMGASTEIIGVQTEAFPSMVRSIESGHVVEVPAQRTIADGIAVRAPGNNTFSLVQQYVDSMITVSEEDITRAILALIENERVIAEGAGATPVAALLAGKLPHLKGKRVCLVISGGNIDTNVISDIIQRGLVRSGRRVELEVAVPDRPGTLARLTTVVAEEQANVLEIRHERAFSEVSLGETDISLWLETRSTAAIHTLCARLEREGFRVRRNSIHNQHDSH
ncbi:MAG: threonine dehydratase [Bradymonadia bacterium]|jgi:threonine dehydratase